MEKEHCEFNLYIKLRIIRIESEINFIEFRWHLLWVLDDINLFDCERQTFK